MCLQNSALPVYGPRPFTAFDLRGIRFFFPADNDNPGGGGGGGNDDDKKFTQADLDRVTGERLARERKNFDGFDDYKSKAEKWDAFEAEQAKKNKGGAGGDDKGGDDKGKGGDQPGLDEQTVQQRIDEALQAERVRGGSKLVSVELDKALEDRFVEPSKLVGFDRAAFVTAEGDVDKQKLADWVKDNTTESKTPQRRRDPSQGQRDATAGSGSVQSGRELYEQRHAKKK